MQIELTYKREDLESIYFLNGERSGFNKRGIKQLIIISCVSIVLLVISFIKADDNPEIPWIMGIVFSFLILVSSIIVLAIRLYSFYKWKRSVIQFINTLVGTKENIHCTPSSITFSNSKETSIIKWELVQQVKIYPQYVLLKTGEDSHILPACSMNTSEYEALKDFLVKKLQ